MATSRNQKSSLILILIAFFMEFLAILVLLPNNYLERQIRKEQMIIANRFNDDTIKWLSEFSRDAHKQVIYDSGFYDALHHAFIPTKKEKKKSGKLAGMGASFFNWADQRVNTFVNLMFQYICRIGLFLLWFKPFALLCVLCVASGSLKRRIKQFNFEIVSTVRQTYAIRMMVGTTFLILFGFFLPIPIDPYIVPAMLLLFALSLGVMVANTQKRI